MNNGSEEKKNPYSLGDSQSKQDTPPKHNSISLLPGSKEMKGAEQQIEDHYKRGQTSPGRYLFLGAVGVVACVIGGVIVVSLNKDNESVIQLWMLPVLGVMALALILGVIGRSVQDKSTLERPKENHFDRDKNKNPEQPKGWASKP